jgi:anti-sigma regulatory factor (Ser/Thr protein kinase)/serine/threonine protein phosphatase PrpC
MDAEEISPLTLDVWTSGGRYAARRRAAEWVRKVGFSGTAAEEIEIVVSELGSNLLKHAGGGMLRLERLDDAGRIGLRLESIDEGPGIADAGQAMTDGYSTAGSLGYGLGAIHRLMDEVDLYSDARGGTRIRCIRWIRRESREPAASPLAFGVITRPHPKTEENGDAFVVRSWGDHALVGVIDGLGHGQFALRAAQAARHYVERHHDQPLDRIFLGAHRACRGTRGVVMALARFDFLSESLTFGSVGNIEARVRSAGPAPSLVVRRGVVGLNAPPPRVTTAPWPHDAMLVLHSDGLSTRWSWDDFPGIHLATADEVARRLFRELAKPTDDATIAVIKRKNVPEDAASRHTREREEE